ncbi:MAG: hypothetical protein KY459_05780 [Acidobacteria bacterium]|nr:hypothetical protein [Acidobacteriota bacterium]
MLTTTKPIESPEEPSPRNRLTAVLGAEGFSRKPDDDEWAALGDEVWHRRERVLFAEGETVFIFLHTEAVSEKVIDQAMGGVGNLFIARARDRKAGMIFQTTTVYVVIVGESGAPHRSELNGFVTEAKGAVIVPVVMMPEINTVVYPDVELERKLGAVRVRVEYLRYLLGERGDRVDVHKGTIATFWVSVAFVGLLFIAGVLTMIL